MEINLLRSPQEPDRFADLGKHEFTYALYPHQGSLSQGRTVQAAAELNQPAQVVIQDGQYQSSPGLLSVDGEGVVCEAIKKSEREDCLIIRLYESLGRHCRARLKINRRNLRVYATDLLEKAQKRLPVRNQVVALGFRPFEIKTIKVHCPGVDKQRTRP